MGLISVPSDPVPAWAKIDLQLHEPYRIWLGFGRLRCAWCGHKWGRHGCPSRKSAARIFVSTASPAQREAAIVSGDLTESDLRLHRTSATGHRRKPSPRPRFGPEAAEPNPITALLRDLEHELTRELTHDRMRELQGAGR